MAVKPIPEGFRTVTPYLIIKGAAAALEFYKKAFGAVEVMRYEDSGQIAHAEMRIGDSIVMLSDEHPQMGYKSPVTIGGTATGIHLYVEDVDALFNRAVAAGAKVTRPLVDQFYGDRTGSLVDPFGHMWSLGTHKEDVSEEEMRRRMQKLQGGAA